MKALRMKGKELQAEGIMGEKNGSASERYALF